jgi:ATP-dependent protease ClpP protease subunit
MRMCLAVLVTLFCSLLPQAAQSEDKPLVLSKRSTLVLRGVVTSESVAKLEVEALQMSLTMNPNETIYLVLDTPGGSVPDGNQLIDFLKALPQKVKTVTIFAASMGFHIAQNLDERMILPSGTLMSHRAAISGMSGQVPGELNSRLFAEMQVLRHMDEVCAARMKYTLQTYREYIQNELWLSGQDAVTYRAADRITLVKCDGSLSGMQEVELGNFMGANIFGMMSNCPLITGILKVRIEEANAKAEDLKAIREFAETYKLDKTNFVRKYISTGLIH